jgi:uncharacterized heparinase superfamily protein
MRDAQKPENGPLEREEDGDIPPGKRLVRTGGGAGLSLGERLAAQFYRLSWRTPLHALRLRGRHPLKLMAAPTDPVAGDPAAGDALMSGRLTYQGESLGLGEGPPDLVGKSAAFVDHYHSFVWLRDLAATGDAKAAKPIAEAAMRHWLTAHGETVSEPAWRPDLAARRLLHWPCHARLILANNDLVYRSTVLNTLARTARHVERAAARCPAGIERIAAWSGVVSAGLLIAGGDARRAYGETSLAKALGTGLSDDGGMLSRSPAEQADVVAILSSLASVYLARKAAMPEAVSDALTRTVSTLLGVTLGDGALSSWQGALPLPKARIDALVAASGERVRPLRHAGEWGYQRLSAGQTLVICDAGPPPHIRTARSGCASTLAIEMSDGAHRVIINCGGASAASLIPISGLGEGLRTSAAHSSLILSDSNSTAILASGGLGKGVDEVELSRNESDSGSRLEASHDGYAKRYGFLQRRSIALSVDGRELRGEDTLIPAGGKRKPVGGSFAARFHLAPGIEITPTADGLGALLRIEGGALWQFRCRGGTLATDASIWVDGEGRMHDTQQLVISGESAAGGATIGWVFKRAG